MKKSYKKGTETRKRINNILSEFSDRAEKNKIRWSYQNARKIYLESKETKRNYESLFREKIKKSKQNKIYYVKKKYNLETVEAKNLVELRIKKNIPYSEQIKEVKEKGLEFPDLFQNLLQLNDFLISAEKDGLTLPNASILIEFDDIYFNDTISVYINTYRQEFRKLIEDREDLVEYPVLNILFRVKTIRDKAGKIKNVIVSFFSIGDIQKWDVQVY